MENSEKTVLVAAQGRDSQLPVSMQLYQAIYNDITGKTEKLTDSYNRFYEISLSDITNLEQRIAQFCEQYHIHVKKRQRHCFPYFRLKGTLLIFRKAQHLQYRKHQSH